jgi:hypothetical protein
MCVLGQPTMESLVESCNNDIRWVLNTLQMRRKASTRLCYDDVAKQGAGGSAKDVDLSPFNVTDLLLGPFCSQRSITERINLMFQVHHPLRLIISVLSIVSIRFNSQPIYGCPSVNTKSHK